MEKIKLSNRYKADIWIEEVGKNLWVLKSKDPKDLDYMRVIFNDDKSIHAIDPSGGPFLSVGGKLTNKNHTYEICSISPMYIFELKELKIG